MEVVVFFVAVHVVAGGLPLRGSASGWWSDWVEAMRAGDGGGVWHALRRGRGMSSAAAAASTRLRTIRGHLTGAEIVEAGWGDACTVGGCERARRGRCGSVGAC